jgi:molybdopterin-containing oxidoreductase family iron-sulfur binding subunit
VSLPAGAEGLSKLSAEGKAAQWASVIAKELSFAKGRSVVAAGPRQPAWVHATALAINAALGNIGKTVQIVERPKSAASARLADVVAGLEKGDITAVVVLGANPAYTAPADLNFASAFSKASTRVHLGASLDETGALAQWHVPLAHYLEAWGDLRASDGSISVQQPLIAPLYPAAKSVIEVLLALQGQKTSGYDAVRATWSSLPGAGASDKGWRKALHSGVVENTAYSLGGSVPDFSSLAGSIPASVATSGFEVVYALDYKVLDGRHTNNPWLQELPDPVTKLTWDNAAYVSPATAEKLGLPPTGAIGQYEAAMLSVAIDGRSLELAGWPTPGVAPDTVIIPQGYGRKVGHFATGTGFNANAVRTTANAYFGVGAAVSKAQGSYTLATTQDHGSTFDGRTNRPIVREATFGDYKKEPNFVEKSEIMPKEKIKSLAPEPPANPLYPQQWGMAIDLNACIGCNACTIACQAENNIPVVGKERILNGREMHWIRLDRYFSGDPEAPRAITQPLPCAHCETAPCETVCPVGATIHSPEGLNDMAYNRCIGTRYCSNNCPFKVRRYNFFHYTQENDRDIPLVKLQRNPDVTVRFRGVMEKCTYCVQRIQGAKIEQKRGGSDKIPDGAVIPACAQACPTNAITFGDVADPNTKVAAAKADPRNYVLLRELNLRARTSYLARISNPNPELA